MIVVVVVVVVVVISYTILTIRPVYVSYIRYHHTWFLGTLIFILEFKEVRRQFLFCRYKDG